MFTQITRRMAAHILRMATKKNHPVSRPTSEIAEQAKTIRPKRRTKLNTSHGRMTARASIHVGRWVLFICSKTDVVNVANAVKETKIEFNG